MDKMSIRLVNLSEEESTKIMEALGFENEFFIWESSEPLDHKSVWGWAVAITTFPVLNVVKGAGGFAGGNPQAKTAVIGDVFIDAVMGRFNCFNRILKKYPTHGLPYKLLTKAAQVGAAQHEWAHVMDEDGVWEGHDEDRWWEG